MFGFQPLFVLGSECHCQLAGHPPPQKKEIKEHGLSFWLWSSPCLFLHSLRLVWTLKEEERMACVVLGEDHFSRGLLSGQLREPRKAVLLRGSTD